jgi:hypothetical protein
MIFEFSVSTLLSPGYHYPTKYTASMLLRELFRGERVTLGEVITTF